MQQRRGGAGIPALQVLRNADFRTLWFFGASAEVARRWELLTLSWFVLQETDSALQLGLPWVFHNLPRPLFGAFFGALADRYGRRSLLMLAQTINALTAVTILALFVSDVMQPWHAFVAAFFSGTSRTLEDPARRTSTFDIVGPRRLVNAISLETLGSTVGRMTGYLMAGGMISLLAFEGAYGLVLGIHLLALSLLLRVKIPAHAPGDKGREPFLKGLKEAMRFAAGNPMLKGVLYASIMMNLLVFLSSSISRPSEGTTWGLGRRLWGCWLPPTLSAGWARRRSCPTSGTSATMAACSSPVHSLSSSLASCSPGRRGMSWRSPS